jgi:hypothetical protein
MGQFRWETVVAGWLCCLHRPVAPSMRSRSRSVCPLCRAYSAIMFTMTRRSETIWPFSMVPVWSSDDTAATISRERWHFVTPSGESLGHAPVEPVEVLIRVVVGVIEQRDVLARELDPEPPPLHTSEVPDQPVQAQRRRGNTALGEPLRRDAGALCLERRGANRDTQPESRVRFRRMGDHLPPNVPSRTLAHPPRPAGCHGISTDLSTGASHG